MWPRVSFPVSFSHLSPLDALLADLESTGSPLARCPVLLTSDPPKGPDVAPEDPNQARPPPPAYTPQQVDPQLQETDMIQTNFLIDPL